MRNLIIATLAITLVPLFGCGALFNLLQPNTTEVRLVNDGDHTVDVTLYYGDDQETIEAVLTETGTKLEYNIEAGQSVSFNRNCGELQAIIIENAALDIIGEIGPEADTEVLRDGTDFNCGDRIVFTFTHSAAIIDFEINTAVQQRDTTPF